MKPHFKSSLLFFFVILTSIDSVGQVYSIQGEEGYTKPDFFIFSQMDSDPAGVYSHFLSAFQRAGFTVVNPGWAQQQIKSEQSTIRLARFMTSLEGEITEEDLKDQLRASGQMAGWKNALNSLVTSGHIIEREQVIEGERRNKRTSLYSWLKGKEVPEETWSDPNSLHIISFNYTYRESMSCGTTLSEIHGSIRDISGELNEQIIDFDFSQPLLASECTESIANEIVRRITEEMRENVANHRATAQSEVSFNITGDSNEISQVQTILTIAKPGTDCKGINGTLFEDELALGLLESYDVIDRSVTNHIIQEHKLNMDGLFRDSDFIEAGQFAGAEALVTIQATCLSNTNILKVKMISINSSLLLWSAILKNSDRSITSEEVLEAIHN